MSDVYFLLPAERDDVTSGPDTKMDSDAIVRVLIKLLHETVDDPPQVGPETNIVADLGLESIQIIEYLCEVEDRFDLAIDEEALADVQTVSDLAGVIDNLLIR